MTSAIVKAQAPWAQRPDESEDEFRSFIGWLMSSPRRSPPADMAQTATRLDWTSRAMAYDASREVPRDQQSRLRLTADNMLELALLSSSRLLMQQQQSPMAILTPKELVQLVGCLTQLGEVEGLLTGDDTESAGEMDLSALTDEEFQALAAAQAVLRRLGG